MKNARSKVKEQLGKIDRAKRVYKELYSEESSILKNLAAQVRGTNIRKAKNEISNILKSD